MSADLKIPKGYALVWLDRSYDQRAKAIIAFNSCKGDLDDKLGAAFAASVAASPPPKAKRKTPSSLAKQIEDAKAEYDRWTPEKRASVKLEGTSNLRLSRCAASSDGDCSHPKCPQLRDGEPARSGRHCPADL